VISKIIADLERMIWNYIGKEASVMFTFDKITLQHFPFAENLDWYARNQ
jgi:hypothetical protein